MALLLVARASVRGSQVATRNSGSFPPYYAGARPLSARDQSVARFLLHLTTSMYACDQTLPFCEGAGPQTTLVEGGGLVIRRVQFEVLLE